MSLYLYEKERAERFRDSYEKVLVDDKRLPPNEKVVPFAFNRPFFWEDPKDPQYALEIFSEELNRTYGREPDKQRKRYILTVMGCALIDLKRPSEAFEQYHKALCIEPDCIYALTGLATALLNLKRPSDAIYNYEIVLEINPNYRPAIQGRDSSLQLLDAETITYNIQKQLSGIKGADAWPPMLWPMPATTQEGCFDNSDPTAPETKETKTRTIEPVTSLDLRSYPLSQTHIALLKQLAPSHPTLTSLHLNANKLTADYSEFRSLFMALKQNTCLRELILGEHLRFTIKNYLYRNELIAADSISSEELRKIFSEMDKDDLQLILTQHPTIDAWDLSKTQLNEKTIVQQTLKLPHYPALHRLNLSDNFLGDLGAQQIAILLKSKTNPLPSLSILELRNNGIGVLGFSYLSDAMSPVLQIEELDFSLNNIQISGHTLKEKGKEFTKNDKLQHVILSGNNLLESADPLFLENESEVAPSDEKTGNNPAHIASRIGFFQSHPITKSSMIDPSKSIDAQNWVVAIACPKHKEHAMIYLEGMRSSGQHFILFYHITSTGYTTPARVECVTVDTLDLRKKHDNYYFLPYKIDDVQGKTLQNHIQDQINKEIKIQFSIYSGSNDEVNCASWCRIQLKKIKINVPETDIPSFAARGKSCSIL